MKDEAQNESILIQYLLGELGEKEQSQIEERYFLDKSYRRELQAAERDLIDSYVLDDLPRREREQFEKYFMRSPARKERVEFARALAKSISPTKMATSAADSRRRSVSWSDSLLTFINAKRRAAALAAATVLAIVSVLWLIITIGNQTFQKTGDDVTRKQDSPPQTSQQPSSESPQPGHGVDEPEPMGNRSPEPSKSTPKASSRIATFVLTPNLVRGSAEAKDLIIPRGKQIIRFQFSLEEHKNYEYALLTPEGERVWNDKKVSIKTTEYGKVVFLEVPTKILEGRDYVLKLSAITADGESKDIGKYYFKVVNR
jgi:hypothetical protein